MITTNDPLVIKEIFSPVMEGDGTALSREGSPTRVGFIPLSQEVCFTWGSFSSLSGLWHAHAGISLTVNTGPTEFFFDGMTISNHESPLALTVSRPGIPNDFVYQHRYETIALHFDLPAFIKKFETVHQTPFGETFRHSLVNLHSAEAKRQLLDLIESMILMPPQDTASAVPLADTLLETVVLSLDNEAVLPERAYCINLALKAHELLTHSLHRSISISDICGELRVSARTLQKGFKELYGVGIIEYHRNCRLLKIRETIRKTRNAIPLGKLIEAHGFSHAGRFSHYYKQQFGVCPSQDSS